MSRVFARSVLAVALSLLVAGCGGSDDAGGGGGDAIQVTCSPASIRTYLASWETGQGLVVRATLSPVPPAGYPQILDSGNVLVAGSTYATANPDGSFSVNLRIRDDLAPGTYTGTFTLRLCTDYACTSSYPLTGNSVPYTITKTPAATTTGTADLQVNGVSSGTGGTVDGNGVKHYAVSMPSGATLTMVTSVGPIVSWGIYGGTGYPTVHYTGVSSTQVSAVLTLSVPGTTQTTTLEALASDGQMFSVAVTVTPP